MFLFVCEQALAELRASGYTASLLQEGSWEERMVAQCRTRLAVRPKAGRAVLFYSQHADGHQDFQSHHGACPVLSGEKWAANLWVWNTPREGFDGWPVNAKYQQDDDDKTEETARNFKQIKATFKNAGTNPKYQHAELYWDKKQLWGDLGHGKQLVANTYQGHQWDVKVDGEFVQTWHIGSEEQQTFVL